MLELMSNVGNKVSLVFEIQFKILKAFGVYVKTNFKLNLP